MFRLLSETENASSYQCVQLLKKSNHTIKTRWFVLNVLLSNLRLLQLKFRVKEQISYIVIICESYK